MKKLKAGILKIRHFFTQDYQYKTIVIVLKTEQSLNIVELSYN